MAEATIILCNGHPFTTTLGNICLRFLNDSKLNYSNEYHKRSLG